MKTLFSLELFSVKLIIVMQTVFLFVFSNWTIKLIITQTGIFVDSQSVLFHHQSRISLPK